MRAVSEHPYAAFLGRVQKPARYLGGEHGEIRKDWDAVSGRMCLAFPDAYDVGMSHLGYRILYSLLNRAPDLLAERAYAPWIDMAAELRARNEPLRSLETWHALHEFDVVGFSLQFELTFTTILLMLELGGIPLRSSERDDAHPLVLAGGPTATHPEPIAPFIDAFLIGDGEERTPDIVRDWVASGREGLPRAARLARLAKLGGVYVPSLYAVEPDADTGIGCVTQSLDAAAPLPVQRAFVGDLAKYPFPTDGPIASTETVFDRVSVEIARGCTEGCRFCQAGMIYRPVRERDPDEVIGVVKQAVREGGYDGASLTSLSTADYSAISPLVHELTRELKDDRVSLSVSSLRAYGLPEDVLDDLKDSGARGLTFAPEAGSQRMRDVVNKNVTEEQLMQTAERVFSRGWSRMKLYFMIGLPTEEDEDVLAIVETGARALAIGRHHMGRRAQVTVSVSTHVPKPHTPFQWCAMDAREDVLRKQRLLKDAARRTGVDLRLHDSAGSWIEGVLARGDRALADVIEGAYRRGACFDAWEEQFKLDAWREAFETANIDPARYLGTLPTSARLPWNHIDVGLAPRFLEREYRRAVRNRLSPPCGKAVGMIVHHTNLQEHDADPRKLVCYDCGVACDMQQMRQERAGFLHKLGALEPRPPVANPTPAPAPQTKRGPRRPPQHAPQGEGYRLRLRYQKLGRAAFGSHLDLVRLLPRLFRRLGLRLRHSEGFRPRPKLSFGPALPLGVLSLAEYVDVALLGESPSDLAALPEALSQASLDGIRFVEASLLVAGDAKLGALIDEAVYVAALPRAALHELGLADEETLAQLFSERQQGALHVRRNVDGIGRTIDVGSKLLSAEVGHGTDTLAAAGLLGDFVPVRLRVRCDGEGSCKPSEAITALTGHDELPVRHVREALVSTRHDMRVTPMELKVLRAARARRDEQPTISP